MDRRNLIITVLALLAALAVGSTGYLLAQTRSLKNEIVQQKNENEPAKETAKETPKKSSDEEGVVTQFMNEDELLANFFALPEAPKGDPESTDHYLVITPEIADLGTISKADGPVRTTFSIKNEGDATVTLTYAFASCGCTTASLKEKTELEPGASFPLEVSYDPNFYGANYELGEITKSITVFSNDPTKPFYKVSMKANVTP